jgi:hypothetical protein
MTCGEGAESGCDVDERKCMREPTDGIVQNAKDIGFEVGLAEEMHQIVVRREIET